MGKGRLEKYTNEALETKQKIIENRYTYTINKVYKNEEHNIYWYINQHGYLHILKPHVMKREGEVLYYYIEDFLLTKENTLKNVSSSGMFKTPEECIKELEDNIS